LDLSIIVTLGDACGSLFPNGNNRDSHRKLSGNDCVLRVLVREQGHKPCWVAQPRELGNRPLLLRCRTPPAVWTVKRPGDLRIDGAQFFAEVESLKSNV